MTRIQKRVLLARCPHCRADLLTCSVHNCTRPCQAGGLCNAHYMRHLRYGTTRPTIPIKARTGASA